MKKNRSKLAIYQIALIVVLGLESTSVQAECQDLVISRADYQDKLYGFWLGQNIANWTGLVTEGDKIGNIGEIKTGAFYTRDDWGKPDQPAIWADGKPSDLSPTIDFVFRGEDEVWGADDDTDIEYMYQHLMHTHKTSKLTPEQIRDGWLKHIKAEEENYIWVTNQRSFDLMKQGVLPPATSDPKISSDEQYDNYYEMIDAQLTTEIFGLFAPGKPEVAIEIATLPIRTTAHKNAAWISSFYVAMYSLASIVPQDLSDKDKMLWMSKRASRFLPEDTYSRAMYDFVKQQYEQGLSWEQARDAVYQRYQVEQQDGYNITSKNLYCNGCFAGGINFAASLISLFWGEGDIKQTIKIGTLAGWDSDNPTATWGGMLGFMLGREGVEQAFDRKFSDRFNIHRTRQGFDKPIDDFNNMASVGVQVTERVVSELMSAELDQKTNSWRIPNVCE